MQNTVKISSLKVHQKFSKSNTIPCTKVSVFLLECHQILSKYECHLGCAFAWRMQGQVAVFPEFLSVCLSDFRG